jgi:deoxyadenosine/deoxycytidine kinase
MITPKAFPKDIMIENKVHFAITIRGNIGSGKTKLINELKTKKDLLEKILGKPCFFVDEPVKVWKQKILNDNTQSPLDLFYMDKERNAFAFQIIAFTTRMNALINETKKLTQLSVGIYDRDMSDDYLFLLNLKDKITQIEWYAYNIFYKLVCGEINRIYSIVIYNSCIPNECYTRILERDGKEIPIEYLESIHLLHQQMISEFQKSGGHVLVFNPGHIKDDNQYSKFIDNFINTDLTNLMNKINI